MLVSSQNQGVSHVVSAEYKEILAVGMSFSVKIVKINFFEYLLGRQIIFWWNLQKRCVSESIIRLFLQNSRQTHQTLRETKQSHFALYRQIS
jgi:hypothetical protein